MSDLTHLDEQGAAHMVDISGKQATDRTAIATGEIHMSDAALAAIKNGDIKKGDVLGTARIAGIMAAKHTSDLIPLCHPLALTKVVIAFDYLDDGIKALATVRSSGSTGVEMEALTAVNIALLTIYDMAKAIDKAMVIGAVMLLEKRGGKSGIWSRP